MSFVSKLSTVGALILAVGATSLAAGCGSSTPGAKSGGGNAEGDLTGKAAPDFTVKTKGGKSFKLSEAKGKVLVLDFWATWCGPCRESFPLLEKLSKKHKKDAFELVAINIDDTPADVDDFLASTDVHFTIGFDPGGEKVAGKKYPIPTMPTTYVIDASGKVRHVHAGFHDGEAEELEAEVTKLLKTAGGGEGGGEEE